MPVVLEARLPLLPFAAGSQGGEHSDLEVRGPILETRKLIPLFYLYAGSCINLDKIKNVI